MLWLALLGATLGFVYLNFIFFRFKSSLPYAILLYLTYFYLTGGAKIGFGPVNVHGWDILFVFCSINILYRLFFEKVQFNRGQLAATVVLGFYVFYLEFSEIYNFLLAGDRALDNFIRATIENCYPIVALSIVLNIDRTSLDRFVSVTLVCGVTISVWVVFREVFDLGSHITSTGTVRRLRGESVLFLLFILSYALFSERTSKPLRLALGGLSLAAIALVGHRSGFLSVAWLFFCFIVFLVARKQLVNALVKNTHYVMFGGILVVGILAFSQISAVENFLSRASETVSTEDRTSSDRLNKWRVALKSTKENLLGGTKLNLLPDYYGHYVSEAQFGALDIQDAHMRMLFLQQLHAWPPHNIFVNIVSRNGAVGLILFLAFVVYTLRYIVRECEGAERYMLVSWIMADLIFLQFNNQHTYDAVLLLNLALYVFPLLYGRRSTVGEKIEDTPSSKVLFARHSE